MNALPIIHRDRDAASVSTAFLTAQYVNAGHAFMDVSAAFMAAQDALGVSLKWDRASNRGWITLQEAKAIRAHMDAALGS